MGRLSSFAWFGGGSGGGGDDTKTPIVTAQFPSTMAKPQVHSVSSPYGHLWYSGMTAAPDALSTFVVQDASKVLPNGRVLFKDVNLSLTLNGDNHHLGRPDIVVLRGPSGAGKTTLLRCLAELDSLTTGQVLLGPYSPHELGYPDWRARVLYVPQKPGVMSGTPQDFVDNVASFAVQRRRARQDDYMDYGEQFYLPSSVWDRPWSHLSGGEMQRVVLSLALWRQPNVLLLDEPTSALDPEATIAVEKTLKTRACIWITHNDEQERRVATQTASLTEAEAPSVLGVCTPFGDVSHIQLIIRHPGRDLEANKSSVASL